MSQSSETKNWERQIQKITSNVPDFLLHKERWLFWKREERDGQPTKVPYDPHNPDEWGSSTDPETWASWDQIKETDPGNKSGFGFSLDDTRLVGIDLDYCFERQGVLMPWAQELVEKLDSYTEYSPSKNGLHIIVKDVEIPDFWTNTDNDGSVHWNIEIYDSGRYFTMTGDHYDESPSKIRSVNDFAKILKPFAPDPSHDQHDLWNMDETPSIYNLLNQKDYPPEENTTHPFHESETGTNFRVDQNEETFRCWRHEVTGNVYHLIGIKHGIIECGEWDSSENGNASISSSTWHEIFQKAEEEGIAPPDLTMTEERANAITESVIKAITEDSQAPYREEAVEAAAWLKVHANYDYQKYRETIDPHLRNKRDLNQQIKEAEERIKSEESGSSNSPLSEGENGYIKTTMQGGEPTKKRISNFTITLRERLYRPDNREIVTAKVNVHKGKDFEITLTPKDLKSKDSLLSALPTSEVFWKGYDKDVQHLRELLLEQNVKRADATKILGRHKDQIVLPEKTLDKNGCVDDPELKLFNKHRKPRLNTSFTLPEPDQHQRAAEAIFKHLPRVNKAEITVPIISWFFALPWSAPIREKTNLGFPHLVLYGRSGSGKTTYGETILRLSGLPRTLVSPTSLPGTKFTRVTNYNHSNLLPVFMDEFRLTMNSSFISKFVQELNELYGGAIDQRGRRDQTTEQYKLVAPIILAGEDRPQDSAFDQRILAVNLKGKIDNGRQEFRDAFESLNEASLDAFAVPYWTWSLNQKNWLEDWHSEREFVEQDFAPKTPERTLNNLATMRFGWEMFNRYAEELGLSKGELIDSNFNQALETAFENLTQDGKELNNLDRLLKFLSVMVTNDRIEKGKHFATKSDGETIVIRLDTVIPEARKYASETDAPIEILGASSYDDYVEELSEDEDSYVVAKSLRTDFNRVNDDEDRTQLRGVGINATKLEKKLDIEPQNWFRSANIGESRQDDQEATPAPGGQEENGDDIPWDS